MCRCKSRSISARAWISPSRGSMILDQSLLARSSITSRSGPCSRITTRSVSLSAQIMRLRVHSASSPQTGTTSAPWPYIPPPVSGPEVSPGPGRTGFRTTDLHPRARKLRHPPEQTAFGPVSTPAIRFLPSQGRLQIARSHPLHHAAVGRSAAALRIRAPSATADNCH